VALRMAIVTCSDTRSEAEDTAGAALRSLCEERGWEVVAYQVCTDTRDTIRDAIVACADEFDADIVLTCGGTGLGPRDVTPEATRDACDRDAPGFAEAIRRKGAEVTGRAVLSRGVSAARGRTLVVNLPGSRKGAVESFEFVADQFEHAVDMLSGGGH